MFIDTHCHLNFKAFETDLPQVIARARERGVEKIIIPGTDLASSKRAIEIAQQFPGCYAAIGIHPHHAKDPHLKVNQSLYDELKELIFQNRPARNASRSDAGGVVAIGEIGIDYHEYKMSKYPRTEITPELKEKQFQLFELQLRLAADARIPAILHCRDAHEDMIRLIQTISSSVKITAENRETPTPFPGVFHCWGGSKKHLRLLISMGYYIGFDGNISYSSDWAQFVTSTPLDRLLLETDSPYLTPEPHRNERNEPQFLPLVAEMVAKYQGIPLLQVAEQTSKNAATLFAL